MSGGRSVIKVFLVNGESRSVRLDERMDVTVGIWRKNTQLIKFSVDICTSVLAIITALSQHIPRGVVYTNRCVH